ncbi:dead deah box helicase domain-containing protein, partial [Cystoisospora suis]
MRKAKVFRSKGKGNGAPSPSSSSRECRKVQKSSSTWRPTELDAWTFRECQMEGMAELEEMDGGSALIISPSFDSELSTISSGESPKEKRRKKEKGKGRETPNSSEELSGTSPVTSDCAAAVPLGADDSKSKDARRAPRADREKKGDKQTRDSGQVASSQVDKVRGAIVKKRKKTSSESRTAPPVANGASSALSACSPQSANDSSSSSSALTVGSLPPDRPTEISLTGGGCSLEDATEHWRHVVELREALPLWCSAVDEESLDLLHPAILRSLYDNRFVRPTPIQKAVLLPSLRDRKDIVGAAETGSGKTLAYGVPIVCNLLSQMLRRAEKELEKKTMSKTRKRKRGAPSGEELTGETLELDLIPDEAAELTRSDDENNNSGRCATEMTQTADRAGKASPLSTSQRGKAEGPECLVVVPSRELALQVQRHLAVLCAHTPIALICLVGGLAVQKQLRQIGRLSPSIVIATPGRLFSVIQEARAFVSRLNSSSPRISLGGPDGDSSPHTSSALVSADGMLDEPVGPPAFFGTSRQGLVARAHMFMANFEKLRFVVLDEADHLMQEGGFREMRDLLDAVYGPSPNPCSNTKKTPRSPGGIAHVVGRQRSIQTFVFSATLAIGPGGETKDKRGYKQKNRNLKPMELLMECVRLRKKQLCIVDFTRGKKNRQDGPGELSRWDENEDRDYQAVTLGDTENTATEGGPVKLPEGLTVTCVKAAAEEKELYLGLFLLTLFSKRADSRLKAIVFVNSISYVYRLDPILSLMLRRGRDGTGADPGSPMDASLLTAEVVGLHSNLQQKQRLKRLERFQKAPRGVLVCTDVASRGLDLREVREVVHFQTPRSAAVFVHRSGRTARAGDPGEVVCVCEPKEIPDWLRVLKPLQIQLSNLDQPQCMRASSRAYSQLSKVKRILALAAEVDSAGRQKLKQRRADAWLRKSAQAADIMLDDAASDEEEKADRAMRARRMKHVANEISQV